MSNVITTNNNNINAGTGAITCGAITCSTVTIQSSTLSISCRDFAVIGNVIYTQSGDNPSNTSSYNFNTGALINLTLIQYTFINVIYSYESRIYINNRMYSASSGDFINGFNTGSGNAICGLYISNSGILYATTNKAYSNGSVYAYDAISLVAVNGFTSPSISNADIRSICVANNIIYVGDVVNNRITTIDATTGAVITQSFISNSANGLDIFDNDLYVLNSGNVSVYNATTGTLKYVLYNGGGATTIRIYNNKLGIVTSSSIRFYTISGPLRCGEIKCTTVTTENNNINAGTGAITCGAITANGDLVVKSRMKSTTTCVSFGLTTTDTSNFNYNAFNTDVGINAGLKIGWNFSGSTAGFVNYLCNGQAVEGGHSFYRCYVNQINPVLAPISCDTISCGTINTSGDLTKSINTDLILRTGSTSNSLNIYGGSSGTSLAPLICSAITASGGDLVVRKRMKSTINCVSFGLESIENITSNFNYNAFDTDVGKNSGLKIGWNFAGGGLVNYLCNGQGADGGHSFYRCSSTQINPVFAPISCDRINISGDLTKSINTDLILRTGSTSNSLNIYGGSSGTSVAPLRCGAITANGDLLVTNTLKTQSKGITFGLTTLTSSQLGSEAEASGNNFSFAGFNSDVTTNSGLKIAWNRVYGTGYVNYLCNGQNGTGGHSFYTCNSSTTTPVLGNIFCNGIGVGITNGDLPAAPLEIRNNIRTGSIVIAYFQRDINTGAPVTGQNTGVQDISIKTVNNILTSGAFITLSDERIKENIVSLTDLTPFEILNKLEPVKYTFRDTVQKGNTEEYGFIAQKVKPLLPRAVTTNEDYVPNIMDFATFYTSESKYFITLKTKSTNTIEIKDYVTKIKTYASINDGSNLELLFTLVKIVDDTTFEVVPQDATHIFDISELFVYGQFVKDFHLLDKSFIIPLNTACIQTLYKTVSKQSEQIEELQSITSKQSEQIEELKTQINKLMSKLQ